MVAQFSEDAPNGSTVAFALQLVFDSASNISKKTNEATSSRNSSAWEPRPSANVSFLVHLLVEPVQHRSHHRRESRAVDFASESSDEIGQAVARWKVQRLLRHLDDAVHQRASANQYHTRKYLLVEAGSLDLFGRMTENLLGARLKNLTQYLPAEHARLPAPDRRHLDHA